MKPIVIIGTGLAGYMLAKELRALNSSLPLVLITDKEGNFYSKPHLSTALSLQRTPEQLITVPVQEMAKKLDATILMRTTVEKIDIDKKQITVSRVGADSEIMSEDLHYSKLILATGSHPIHPQLSGNAAGDLIAVNDLEQYDEFRALITGKKRIALLGAGLVGCEFANDLSNVGYEVTVIAPAPYPVDRLLPEIIGRELENALQKNGVVWHLNTLPHAIDKIDDEYRITCDQNIIVSADVVMSAIGIVPNKKLAEKSGFVVNRGVVVNRYLQTSAEDVYALGDCAEVNGLVLCYTAPLLNCARALAKTLADTATEVEYPCMPVALKTPACPIVVQTPPSNIVGLWQIDKNEEGLKALFHDANNQLYGFALTGKRLKERATLQKEIPLLFKSEKNL